MLYVEWENAICRMTSSCKVWCTLFECSIMRPLFARKQCQAAGAGLSNEPANLSMVARRSTVGVLARRRPTSTLARQTPQRGHVDFGLLDMINCNHEPGVARFLACRIIQPPVRGVSLPSNNWCYRECPRALMQVHIGNTNLYKLSRNRWPGFLQIHTHIYGSF